MERITIKHVRAALRVLAKEMGTETQEEAYEAYRPQEGTYTLDSMRGVGVRVERMALSGHGIDQPFGSKRRSCREMVETIGFALSVLREVRRRDALARPHPADQIRGY